MRKQQPGARRYLSTRSVSGQDSVDQNKYICYESLRKAQRYMRLDIFFIKGDNKVRGKVKSSGLLSSIGRERTKGRKPALSVTDLGLTYGGRFPSSSYLTMK